MVTGREPDPAAARPRGLCWRRRAVVTVTLLAGLLWWLVGEAPEIQVAKGVKLGMTEAEVLAVLGDDPTQMTYRGGILRGATFSRWMTFVRWTRRELNLDLLRFAPGRLRIAADNWPVHIRFDKNGHVDRIKRGSEILEW